MSLSTSGDPVFVHATCGVVSLTRDGLVAELNPEARRILALADGEVVGRPVLELVPSRDRERVKERFLKALRGREVEWTARLRRADGTLRPQRVRAVPLGDPATGVLAFLSDVPESAGGRAQADQLRALLENLPGQFVAVLDPAGRIRRASGLSRTHYRDDVGAVGSAYRDLLAGDEEDARSLAAMLGAASAGEPWAGTQWHRRADGTAFPARTFAAPYEDAPSGQILGTLVVGRDEAAERDANERARRARQLGDLGRMAVAVADAVDGMVGAALRNAEGGGAAEVADVLGAALLGIRRYARSLSAAGEPLPEPRGRIPAGEAVGEAVARLRPWIEAVGAAVRIVEEDDLPPVHADRGRLARVVRILLENALEALADVDVREIEVRLTTDWERVTVRVSDSGGGVEPGQAHRLFDPLYSTKPGRAGLGLAEARATVRGWGGELRLEEGEEERTTFAAELLVHPQASRRRFRPEPLGLGRTRSVLVADDDPGVRASLGKFLERVGFEVREAWSGRSALAGITAGSPPEIILSDLRMDDGSGYWLLEELRRDFPDLVRRTVIVTGDTQGEQVREAASRTGCPVIRKPVDLPELLEVLDEVSRRG